MNTKPKSKHPLYATWSGMIQRCHRPDYADYFRWGGRGITVCEEWHDFFVFAADMGGNKPTPKHEIDRIDNNKGYSKENCRWVTRKENGRNTRRTRFVEFNGECRCIGEWAEIWGIGVGAALYRINAGWSYEKIVSTPIRPKQPDFING